MARDRQSAARVSEDLRGSRSSPEKNLRIGCGRKIVERDHKHRAPVDLWAEAGDELMRETSVQKIGVGWLKPRLMNPADALLDEGDRLLAASSGASSNHGRSGSTESLLSRSKSSSGIGPACVSEFGALKIRRSTRLLPVHRWRLVGERKDRFCSRSARRFFEKAQPLRFVDQPRNRIRERAAVRIA